MAHCLADGKDWGNQNVRAEKAHRLIPKGLRPPAQGCEERATLGKEAASHSTPMANGVVASGVKVETQPRWSSNLKRVEDCSSQSL